MMSIEQVLRDRLSQVTYALRTSDVLAETCAEWGRQLADALSAGHRLLAAGNGGSAAQAQHLTAELVGRFRDERRPFSAIPLHGDTSATTAIGNDYGADEVFARQVEAHGRSGDVLMLLSTSGRSGNVIAAAQRARAVGMHVWALTGPAPNPLATLAHRSICAHGPDTATVQEVHLVALHLVCEAMDLALAREEPQLLSRDVDGSEVRHLPQAAPIGVPR
ncbi:SIS domain-containing protein [Actinocrinis sp.]|uniref:D-sedoheptulose-7-phosphate isomerase n=1 Tax=Actinocrinis sp. TaxID=1920516 RepID=UPI002D4952A0|nr:SIS domain-containing protein [Actinocrinis sp.]HZP50108.1 SIS domain-containing protein [Actinocrinis sp.]